MKIIILGLILTGCCSTPVSYKPGLQVENWQSFDLECMEFTEMKIEARCGYTW